MVVVGVVVLEQEQELQGGEARLAEAADERFMCVGWGLVLVGVLVCWCVGSLLLEVLFVCVCWDRTDGRTVEQGGAARGEHGGECPHKDAEGLQYQLRVPAAAGHALKPLLGGGGRHGGGEDGLQHLCVSFVVEGMGCEWVGVVREPGNEWGMDDRDGRGGECQPRRGMHTQRHRDGGGPRTRSTSEKLYASGCCAVSLPSHASTRAKAASRSAPVLPPASPLASCARRRRQALRT